MEPTRITIASRPAGAAPNPAFPLTTLTPMSGLIIPVYLVLVIGGSVGWVRNIIAVAHSDFSHIDGMTVIRVVGIPAAPIGAVVGWISQ